MNSDILEQAMALFELPKDYDLEYLSERYKKLLYTWHPARYASLTNNPRKYMEMYKKGEAKTKEIHDHYKILLEKLEG
mgnify:CR=1 FL=1